MPPSRRSGAEEQARPRDIGETQVLGLGASGLSPSLHLHGKRGTINRVPESRRRATIGARGPYDHSLRPVSAGIPLGTPGEL
jgi:hypothetical protein